jgi:hypothetical protein
VSPPRQVFESGRLTVGPSFALRSPVLCRFFFRRDNDRVVLHLAGRLGHAQVPDLLAACAREGGPPTIALDDLLSADAVGLDALVRIQRQGIQLTGVSEHLRLELETAARDRGW